MGEDEAFDDGIDFRPPPAVEDRLWRHPAELARPAGPPPGPPTARSLAPEPPRALRRNPWALGFVSVLGSAVLAGSLMFTAGGLGEEPKTLGLRPTATLVDATGGASTAGIVSIVVDADRHGRSGNGMVLADGVHVVTSLRLVRTGAATEGTGAVQVIDEQGATHVGTLVGTDEMNDLAVLRTEATLRPFPDLTAATVDIGTPLTLLGGGRGVGLRGWFATVADPQGTAADASLVGVITLADPLPDAASGAIAVDPQGHVAGLVSLATGTAGAGTHAAAVVPFARVQHAADQFLAHGTIEHGWLGVEASPGETTRNVAQRQDASDDAGLTVAEVIEGSPAAAAGVQPGDVLVRVCGQPVGSIDDVVSMMLGTEPGTVCTIEARRGAHAWQSDTVIGRRDAA